MWELPDVRGETTKRPVSAVHTGTRRLHSNAWRIPPQFNALPNRFQHCVARAFDVDLPEHLGTDVIMRSKRHGEEADARSQCRFAEMAQK